VKISYETAKLPGRGFANVKALRKSKLSPKKAEKYSPKKEKTHEIN
jgi:hypothetical protein